MEVRDNEYRLLGLFFSFFSMEDIDFFFLI